MLKGSNSSIVGYRPGGVHPRVVSATSHDAPQYLERTVKRAGPRNVERSRITKVCDVSEFERILF
jgi:hypothetical protein